MGIICILEPWQLKSDYVSNMLAISGGVIWALSVLVVKKIHLQSPRQLFALTAWQMAFGSAGLIILAFVFPSRPIDWGMPLLLSLTYTIILSTSLGWILWLFILQRLPANISSLSTLAIPVIGTLAAWIQLHDVPSHLELGGMFLICVALGGLALTTESKKVEVPMETI
ncbi:MAG: DMT family transporter [Abditibacteriaceae bacterium]